MENENKIDNVSRETKTKDQTSELVGGISRVTMEKLKVYEASLVEWQNKLNLVSNSSIEDAWNRHFVDSMQLCYYIPKNAKTLYDLGSGAGFPGMVIAIMANELTPSLKVSLIESITKKTLYLNEVKKLTDTKVEIINERAENLPAKKVDVITSRAMTALNKLFEYSFKFCDENTVLIFPKGKKHLEEIREAKKDWLFEIEIIESETSEEGVVLVIKSLKNKKGRLAAMQKRIDQQETSSFGRNSAGARGGQGGYKGNSDKGSSRGFGNNNGSGRGFGSSQNRTIRKSQSR